MKSTATMYAAMSMICFTLTQAAPSVKDAPTADQQTLVMVPGSYVAQQMAFILVPLTLAFVLLLACCCLCRMDPDKSQDTMLYAKFIVVDDKTKQK
jgi:ABC-type transport system involved in cytochrome c biogenesis permease subunit